MDDIDLLILETLSFLEPMTKEMVILDFNTADLKNYNNFNIQILEEKLEDLTKMKKLKKIKKDDETYYIKVMPKRPWWKRLFLNKF